MKKCPKDADTEVGKLCKEIAKIWGLQWYCTRPQNHKGFHHAHGLDKNCYYKWKNL